MRRWSGHSAAALALAAVLAAAAPHAAADTVDKREVPDYDGRGEDPTTAGDVLIWIPRTLAGPLYLTSEYLVRKPLGWLVPKAERNHWFARLQDLFTFGPKGKAGLMPTAFFEFGFRPSGGIQGWIQDVGVEGHTLTYRFATGGRQWWLGRIGSGLDVHDELSLGLTAEAAIRPDHVYYGLGPRSRDGDEARYPMRELRGTFSVKRALSDVGSVRTSAAVRDVAFGTGSCCGEASIPERVEEGAFDALPPGYPGGYTAFEQRFGLRLTSRPPRPEPGGGVTLDLHASLGADVENAGRHSWARYGGQVSGTVDIAGHYRLLSLKLTTEFADPMGDGSVPFTELSQLGGGAPMSGMRPGRLRDRSAAAALLEYRWPVWTWLDGTLHVALGNVFGEHLDGFRVERTRVSFGTGMEAPGGGFNFALAAGTEPLDEGGEVTSVRFVIGTTGER